MNKKSIVCATRGGQGSRVVKEAAILHARQHGCPLHFVYIIDVDRMGEIEPFLLTAVREELLWLGEVLLAIARNQAEEAGVEAKAVIREGDTIQEIMAVIKEENAQHLFLGAPRHTTAHIFGDDAIERMATNLEEQAKIPVHIARPEEFGHER